LRTGIALGMWTGSALVGSLLLVSAAASGQQRCPPGQLRTPFGCERVGGSAPAAARCEAGQVQNVDTEGHCCWPGQTWLLSRGACAGVPVCPSGTEALGSACVAACGANERREGLQCACVAGMSRSADTRGHCCWPGQFWEPSRSACTGAPTQCPSGLRADGDACVRPLVCPAGMVAIPGAAPFCLDRTEVTVAAYGTCSGCTAPNTGGACNWGVAGRGDHPINCVGWNQAVAFCASRGARLPTEAESQLAAAGTDGREYPWGNVPPSDQLCWSGEGARTGTCAVGSFPSGRSPYGAEDLSGNVCEWTSTSVGATRVYRGGGWSNDDAAGVCAASRGSDAPTARGNYLGFRCARGAN